MIEMYLNGEPLGSLPSAHFEQALAYAHTLCKLEGNGAHYSYAKIGGRETIKIYTRVFVAGQATGKC